MRDVTDRGNVRVESTERYKQQEAISDEQSWVKVMFSLVCVCHSIRQWGDRFHLTVTHDALYLAINGTPPTCSNLFNLDLTLEGATPNPSSACTGIPAPQICLNLFIMNHVLLARGRLASHWNTLLFLQVEVKHIRLHLLHG